MTIEAEIVADPDVAAQRGAGYVAAQLELAVAERGEAHVAFSGGNTPWIMLRHLAGDAVPWARVHAWQVDERVAPDGDPDRNLTRLAELLPSAATLHPIPVTSGTPEEAAAAYAERLPASFDVVHLGLGDDGHTASLTPGDPVLDVTDRLVAATQPYRGRRRITLTYPGLRRGRRFLWLVTGEAKVAALGKLLAGDRSIPAGRVPQDAAVLVADEAAMGRS